jgi:salicylate hydroxylase
MFGQLIVFPLNNSLQPNGLSVLAKIPGLLDNLESAKVERFDEYSVVPEDKGLLASKPVGPELNYRGVRRTVFHKALVDAAERHGVEIKWGHKLVYLEQAEDTVTVTFENGAKDTGSFVIGCDGLHSNTRICLFGEEKADFTGLCQVKS